MAWLTKSKFLSSKFLSQVVYGLVIFFCMLVVGCSMPSMHTRNRISGYVTSEDSKQMVVLIERDTVISGYKGHSTYTKYLNQELHVIRLDVSPLRLLSQQMIPLGLEQKKRKFSYDFTDQQPIDLDRYELVDCFIPSKPISREKGLLPVLCENKVEIFDVGAGDIRCSMDMTQLLSNPDAPETKDIDTNSIYSSFMFLWANSDTFAWFYRDGVGADAIILTPICSENQFVRVPLPDQDIIDILDISYEDGQWMALVDDRSFASIAIHLRIMKSDGSKIDLGKVDSSKCYLDEKNANVICLTGFFSNIKMASFPINVTIFDFSDPDNVQKTKETIIIEL